METSSPSSSTCTPFLIYVRVNVGLRENEVLVKGIKITRKTLACNGQLPASL